MTGVSTASSGAASAAASGTSCWGCGACTSRMPTRASARRRARRQGRGAMPLVGIQYGASQLRWTEAMQLAREDENFAYPPPLLAAMQDNREDSIPTASVIAGCLRQFALKRRVEYYERPNGLLPPIFGTAFHAEMEKYTEHDPGQRAFPDDTSGP